MIAAMVKTMTWAVGNANGQEVDLGDEDAGEDQPERDAGEGADQRGDHALVAAEPPRRRPARRCPPID